MNYFVLHAHSGWRWIVLITLLIAIFTAFNNWKKNSPFESKHKKIFMFTMIAYHIQFVVGLVLIFVSTRMESEAFFSRMLMEHISLMVIGMALITIGYSKSKKAEEEKKKFKTVFIFYLITLLLTLAAIPWPFIGRNSGFEYF